MKAPQIKTDEEEHVELKFIKLQNDSVVFAYYNERGGKPTWENKL